MMEVPRYLTFVRGARLWDRGVHHCASDYTNMRPPLPCARFIAHMKCMPMTAEPTHLITTMPHSVKQQNRSTDMPSPSKNIWNNSEFSRGRQDQILQSDLFRQHLYEVPQSPAPSMASNTAEVFKRRHTSAPCTLDRMSVSAYPSGLDEKKEDAKDPELLCIVPRVEDDPDLKELDKLSDYHSPALYSVGESFSNLSRSPSDITINQTSLSVDRSDLSDFSRHVSSTSITDSDQSTSFSRLHSSFFTINALASSSFGSGSDISQNPNKTSQHKSFPLEASSYCSSSTVNPTLNSSSYHGSSDLFQTSSCSVKKCAGQAPSFVEIWHDHHLHHWPVLPPISPQREFTDIIFDEASQVSRLSDDVQTVIDELDELMLHTGSSLSLDDMSHTDISSISEISTQAASLRLGCDDEGKSLSDVRISLLDHQNWGMDNQNSETNKKKVASTQTNEMESGKESEAEFLSEDIYDLLYPDSIYMKEITSSDIYSETRMDDQQSISRMSAGKISSDIFKDESYKYTPTSVEPPSNDNLRRNSSDTELYLVKDYYSSDLLPASKSEGLSYKREDGHCVEKERIGDFSRFPRPGYGRESLKPDHNILQDTEHQLKVNERQAQALKMYSKLQKTQFLGNRVVEQISISKFEDFDFLAKYCIFSKEKLAEYKRAFESVDSDGDGYLNCLEVLMALKEIVPNEALTDAEELYVYRILEIVDYYVTDGLTDLRLFAVIASLAQKIAALDNFMRSLIGRMDFKALELKIYSAQQLFLCNVDPQSNRITVDQLLVELKAGGVSKEHEEAVQRELRNVKTLDILDFMSYLPLFVLIHNSVISNPLDDSRTI